MSKIGLVEGFEKLFWNKIEPGYEYPRIIDFLRERETRIERDFVRKPDYEKAKLGLMGVLKFCVIQDAEEITAINILRFFGITPDKEGKG